MKEYILPSIFLSTMYRSMYVLYFSKFILMVLHSWRRKVPILCYMTLNYWRKFATSLSLSHHCQYMWYCACRDWRRISFWNLFFFLKLVSYLRLGLISSYSSYCSKRRFMWFHRGHSNDKLSIVNRNNLVNYHFSQELVCMFSLKGGCLPHLLYLNIDQLQVTDCFS